MSYLSTFIRRAFLEDLDKRGAPQLPPHAVPRLRELGWERLDHSHTTTFYPAILGVDGGNVHEKLLVGDVFAATAAAVVFNQSHMGNYAASEVRPFVEAGLVIPPDEGESRIVLYRQTLELRAAASSIMERGIVVLVDGSLDSLLSRPREAPLSILAEASPPRHVRRALERVLDHALGGGTSIASRRIDARNLELRDLVFLEVAEKLASLTLLLKRAQDANATLVYLAKTGRGRSVFQTHLPDQYLVTQLTRDPGVTLDYAPKGITEVEPSLSEALEALGLDQDPVEAALVWKGFVRFSPSYPAYPFQFLTWDSRASSRREALSLAREMFSSLVEKGLVYKGYPLPLSLVDSLVHIDKGELEWMKSMLPEQGPGTWGRSGLIR